MIEACNRNVRGTSLNIIMRLVREGASKQKCLVVYSCISKPIDNYYQLTKPYVNVKGIGKTF